MVNAQQYIENNFNKQVSEINAIEKNLEGHLDLSAYPNLIRVDIGKNPELQSLKLAPLSNIGWMSIYGTKITDFSFFANTPNLQDCCLPLTGAVIGS